MFRKTLVAFLLFAPPSLSYSQSNPIPDYTLIGQLDGAFFQAYVPTSSLNYLDATLVGPRSSWSVRHVDPWKSKYSVFTSDIVFINDAKQTLVFVIKGGQWFQLNKMGDLTELSKVLKREFRIVDPLPVSKMDIDHWKFYFGQLTYLYCGVPAFKCLSEEKIDKGNSSAFNSLFKIPQIVKANGITTVSENVLTPAGSVELWSVTFKDDVLDIVSLNRKIVCPDGTFRYVSDAY